MAKKKKRPTSQSSDADRRARQSERLMRVLKVLQCISMSHERWDAERLAQELEVSERTIHRCLQVLSATGVPYYFDSDARSYRVRPGFRFPGIDLRTRKDHPSRDVTLLLPTAERLLRDGEQFLDAVRDFCEQVRGG